MLPPMKRVLVALTLLFSLPQSIRLIPGEWSECSASCGSGVQSRSIDCRAAHPLSGHISLPANECTGQPQLPLFRSCSLQLCAQQEQAQPLEEYHWRYAEWSACSASCLGGKQRALLQCVQLSTGRSVAWSHCDGRRRPPERARECNLRPCPPEWNAGQWSTCPEGCGASRTRRIRCIRAAGESGGAISQMVVPDEECSTADRPEDSQPCGKFCSHQWNIGEWTKCSEACGEGLQRRYVTCPLEGQCPPDKPNVTRTCDNGPCEGKGAISTSAPDGGSTVSEKKLTLGIGGVATLYQGTSIKVKCPRKNFDKKKIYWTKDGKKISNNPHLKVSANGNLRITHARMEDGGLYECFADKLRGNVTIRFKLRDENAFANGLPLKESDPLRPSKAVKGKYKAGRWGHCVQSSCALRGIQERELECFIGEGRSHRKVSLSICETLNVNKPPSSRPCSRIECAHWNATEWSSCPSSPCTRKWTSEQRRSVFCVSAEGNTVQDAECDITSRPTTTAHCANPACVAEWRAGEWAECSASCGTGGVQLRLLQCVWSGTGKPAGKVCDGLQQPRATRACARTAPLPPCSPTSNRVFSRENCEDLSRFCDIIKLFHSCESEQVRQRCCFTCNKIENRRRFF